MCSVGSIRGREEIKEIWYAPCRVVTASRLLHQHVCDIFSCAIMHTQLPRSGHSYKNVSWHTLAWWFVFYVHHSVWHGLSVLQLLASLMFEDQVAFTVPCSTVPRHRGGGRKSAWYTLFVHPHNYNKGHVAELGACTNMTTIHVNSINRH